MKGTILALSGLLLSAVPTVVKAQFGCITNNTIPNTLSITNYTGPGGDVTIPNNINGLKVVSIGAAAFDRCVNLTNVTIANGITSIGDGAFVSCSNMTSITIPGSVNSIGFGAFQVCTSLTNVFFEGNAPPLPDLGLYMFSGDSFVTVYYLPGTIGWSSTFGLPPVAAVLWNPLIRTDDGSFGVQNNQFGFNITGTTNIPIVVEACTNLTAPVWSALASLRLTNGLVYFSDTQWTNYPSRYYRISSH